MHNVAVAAGHVKLRPLAVGDMVHDVAAVFIYVAGKQPSVLAVGDQLAQGAAWPHDFRRQFIHFDIAGVAQDDAAPAIEHAQALRHIVKRVRQLPIGRGHAPV
jgi:hypothetical protein